MEDVGEMQIRRVDLYDSKARAFGVGEAGGFGICNHIGDPWREGIVPKALD